MQRLLASLENIPELDFTLDYFISAQIRQVTPQRIGYSPVKWRNPKFMISLPYQILTSVMSNLGFLIFLTLFLDAYDSSSNIL